MREACASGAELMLTSSALCQRSFSELPEGGLPTQDLLEFILPALKLVIYGQRTALHTATDAQHARLKSNSLGPYALIPGPKERSETMLKLLDEPQKSFTFLDYEMHTGALDGKRVSIGNGGRYAPDTAITTEILCGAGAESLIRVGSCGSLQDHVKIGDLVIVTGALRGDGTSRYYVAENFSTVADPQYRCRVDAGGGGLESSLSSWLDLHHRRAVSRDAGTDPATEPAKHLEH